MIQVENVNDLYGVEVHLSFDPAVMEAVDADTTQDGVQGAVGDWFQKGFIAINKVDNTTGKLDFAVTLLNPSPAVSGSGGIVTITWKANANGVSPVTVDQVILATREGSPIPSQVQSGSVTVSAAGKLPSHPALWPV